MNIREMVPGKTYQIDRTTTGVFFEWSTRGPEYVVYFKEVSDPTYHSYDDGRVPFLFFSDIVDFVATD